MATLPRPGGRAYILARGALGVGVLWFGLRLRFRKGADVADRIDSIALAVAVGIVAIADAAAAWDELKRREAAPTA